jgi:hypothetical protein
MKHITNSRVRETGKRELRRIFKELRFRDGLTEMADTDEFCYWYNKARDGRIGNYIVYEIIDSDAVHRADDAVISRDFFCQIDVFSTRGFETKQLTETLSGLEERLIKNGFEATFKDEEYEPDTRLYHQIIFVSKLYL